MRPARRIGMVGTGFRREDRFAVPRELAAVLEPGHAIEVFAPRLYSLPTTQLDLVLQEVGYIEAGLAAAAAGCDGVLLNTFGDYGLPALKSALRVPVVGAAEASLRTASLLGEPFAIVTIWPRALGHLYAKLLRDYRLEERCCALIHVGEDADLASLDGDKSYIAAMQAGEAELLDRILRGCRQATERGAATIVLGCTCMSPIAEHIARRCEIPVLNPLAVACKALEMQLDLGLRASRVAFPASSPHRNAVLAAMVDGAAPLHTEGHCDMCAVAAETPASPPERTSPWT